MLDLNSSQINRTHVIVFSQEVPNFLRGYHKCSIEDAVQMGSMLFKAKYKDEKTTIRPNSVCTEEINIIRPKIHCDKR